VRASLIEFLSFIPQTMHLNSVPIALPSLFLLTSPPDIYTQWRPLGRSFSSRAMHASVFLTLGLVLLGFYFHLSLSCFVDHLSLTSLRSNSTSIHETQDAVFNPLFAPFVDIVHSSFFLPTPYVQEESRCPAVCFMFFCFLFQALFVLLPF